MEYFLAVVVLVVIWKIATSDHAEVRKNRNSQKKLSDILSGRPTPVAEKAVVNEILLVGDEQISPKISDTQNSDLSTIAEGSGSRHKVIHEIVEQWKLKTSDSKLNFEDQKISFIFFIASHYNIAIGIDQNEMGDFLDICHRIRGELHGESALLLTSAPNAFDVHDLLGQSLVTSFAYPAFSSPEIRIAQIDFQKSYDEKNQDICHLKYLISLFNYQTDVDVMGPIGLDQLVARAKIYAYLQGTAQILVLLRKTIEEIVRGKLKKFLPTNENSLSLGEMDFKTYGSTYTFFVGKRRFLLSTKHSGAISLKNSEGDATDCKFKSGLWEIEPGCPRTDLERIILALQDFFENEEAIRSERNRDDLVAQARRFGVLSKLDSADGRISKNEVNLTSSSNRQVILDSVADSPHGGFETGKISASHKLNKSSEVAEVELPTSLLKILNDRTKRIFQINQSVLKEYQSGLVCAPAANKGANRAAGHNLIGQLKCGDVLLHYSSESQCIFALSMVKEFNQVELERGAGAPINRIGGSACGHYFGQHISNLRPNRQEFLIASFEEVLSTHLGPNFFPRRQIYAKEISHAELMKRLGYYHSGTDSL